MTVSAGADLKIHPVRADAPAPASPRGAPSSGGTVSTRRSRASAALGRTRGVIGSLNGQARTLEEQVAGFRR